MHPPPSMGIYRLPGGVCQSRVFIGISFHQHDFFFSFLATQWLMELAGQGSDPSAVAAYATAATSRIL